MFWWLFSVNGASDEQKSWKFWSNPLTSSSFMWDLRIVSLQIQNLFWWWRGTRAFHIYEMEAAPWWRKAIHFKMINLGWLTAVRMVFSLDIMYFLAGLIILVFAVALHLIVIVRYYRVWHTRLGWVSNFGREGRTIFNFYRSRFTACDHDWSRPWAFIRMSSISEGTYQSIAWWGSEK